MTILAAYTRCSIVELARLPAYSVPTLVFPTLLFLLFGAARADDDPQWITAGFAAFAVLGVAFFQFGVGLASERTSSWERYARTLPVGPLTRLGARVLTAAVFATASAAAVVVAVGAVTGDVLAPQRYAALLLALLLGGIPFALLGIALGYVVAPRAAVPVANLVYLPLAVAGSLWTSPDSVPESADRISRAIPTRTWADVLAAAVDGRAPRATHVLVLLGWTVLFGAIAVIAYRRDEGERFT